VIYDSKPLLRMAESSVPGEPFERMASDDTLSASKADPPLVVDPNGIPPLAVSLQGFPTVGVECGKVDQRASGVENS
jgi:hypothetical protein